MFIRENFLRGRTLSKANLISMNKAILLLEKARMNTNNECDKVILTRSESVKTKLIIK